MKTDYVTQKFVFPGVFCLLLAALLMLPTQAAVVNLANAPLSTTTSSSVKPNLLFILDNSGSMGWNFLPDDVPGSSAYGLTAAQCNGVAYNPAVTYTAPLKSDGSSMSPSKFTAACSDGFGSCSSKNLTGSTYYKYSGSQAPLSYTYNSSGVITSSTFYQECNSNIGSSPGQSVFTKVTVSSTSGPGGSDETQNYANWYTYYSTRILMMKTAVGQAFKAIDSKYRVGFTNISYSGATDGNDFLHIDDFASGTSTSPGQKDKFYTTLYKQSAGGSTPLRGSLAKAGQIYGGKLGADPMQYSCQQNFTILSTDGYWNNNSETTSPNYGPYGLDNTTPVGQQDGTAARPMSDGATSQVTQTTPTVTVTVVTTPKTVVNRSTRTVATTATSTQTQTNIYTRTAVNWARGSCSKNFVQPTTTTYTGNSVQTTISGTTSTQTQEQLTTTGSTDVATTTSTTTHTVITTNGVVTNDTVSNPVVSAPPAVNTVTSGPTTSAWTNVGVPTQSTTGPTISYNPALGSISWGTGTSAPPGACISGKGPGNTDNKATPVLTTAGAPTTSVTNAAPVTSGASQDPTYPKTTPGASTTVVTGPTQGATTTTTVNSGGNANSLADIAMYYYNTDLRNPGNVKSAPFPASCTSGSSTGASLCPTDSNGNYSPNVPGNNVDNNNKPHMTTFTLGLGVNGLLQYSPTYATDTSGDFYSIKTGSKNWPDPQTSATGPNYGSTSSSVVERIDDLWHAAVNGRGTYFSAKNPTALVTSLNSALAGMATRIGYGSSAAVSNLQPVKNDNALYVASYTTAQWTGNLVAESINVDTGAIIPTASWCVENVAADAVKGIAACTGQLASQVSSASDTRTINFNKGGTLTSFTYSGLSTAQQAYFTPSKLSQWSSTFSASDKIAATGDTLVSFLRGQTQYESQTGSTANLYRHRLAILGDIVDTSPAFLGAPTFTYTDPGYDAWANSSTQQGRAKTIFAGANDGMLHAFNAATGVERWAFVPSPVMTNMYWLADLTYTTNHHFYVDGALVTSDVCVSNCSDATKADWRTILMGGLNGGGRGYYAMDVTDPTTPKMLWEFTSLNDADLGYSFGNPLAVKKSDGTWVIAVTSGYDNVALGNNDPYDADGSGQGFLFLLDPLTGKVLSKIGTSTGSKTTPSGLGKISFWADNPSLDATALYAYGGDLLGNLWRFDINAGTVLQIAAFTDGSSNPQSITTRPELAKVNGNRVVYIGTGKYLEASDLDSTKFTTQSIYAIVDNGTTVKTPRTALVQQTLTDAKPNRTITNAAVTIKPPSVMGWFVDFPDSGERNNVDISLVLGTLIVPTNVPTNGVCEAGGYSYLNYLNYTSGSYVPGASSAGVWTGNDLTTGITVVWVKGKPVIIRTGSNSGAQVENGNFSPIGKGGVTGHRVSWREVISK
ncbi:type IV pilus assembly protein PilY1 [Collimonas sp. OK307]|uniref:PilC/PilY family type IV pilus protein n=1 Tax=Collimonas sp. OK307 TaxID=1801620 RepID=UPI0008EB3B60|nr:PilC/PilY family type IV pilus protein [Collimonas sp. OK307]SFI20357.1 type IV pilus assembly protein PilY1 [Collimonas sp. OK307]